MLDIFEFAILIIFASAVLVLYRLLVGPTLYDRILSVNVFGTKTIVVLLLLGFHDGRPEIFIDIAIVYALINFTGILAFLRYVKTGRLDKAN